MSGPFTLDVDAGGVEAAAATLTGLATALDQQAGQLHGTLPGLAHAFRGQAATALGTESAHLATQLTAAAPKVHEAVQALRTLATQYRQAVDTDVPRLNRQWQDALDTHSAALAASARQLTSALAAVPATVPGPLRGEERTDLAGAASTRDEAADSALTTEQHRLQTQFDQLREQLRADTSRAGSALSAAVQIAVPAGAAAAVTPGTVPAWAWNAMAGTLPMTVLSHALLSPPGPTDPAALKKLLDTARAAGLPPTQYAKLLQNYYLSLALQRAGIDWTKWDPSLGADALGDIVYKDYEYFGKLYLAHPEMQWAGMANMIGPSLAGGFLDLDMLRHLAKDAGTVTQYIPGSGGTVLHALAGMSASEAKFFETTFLTMQRNVFSDQAPMHEAYIAGGLPAIREMAAAGLIPQNMVNAWNNIDDGRRTGNLAEIQQGNTDLLHREQYDILAADWDKMRTHDGPVGEALTYALTAVGSPSIPGAHTFAQAYPVRATIETPGPKRFGIPFTHVSFDDPAQGTLTVTTGLPDGNLANRTERWALISQDTLPAFQHLVATDPDRARAIISSSMYTRVQDQRLAAQWPEIVARLTHIGVGFHE